MLCADDKRDEDEGSLSNEIGGSDATCRASWSMDAVLAAVEGGRRLNGREEDEIDGVTGLACSEGDVSGANEVGVGEEMELLFFGCHPAGGARRTAGGLEEEEEDFRG